MKDLHLWHLLQQPELDAAQLVPLLQQLSTLTISQRFPFLGFMQRVLEHNDAKLRAAGVRVLASTSGYLGWKQMVMALDDDDVGVRKAAVETLIASLESDPARCIHVVFHGNTEVRRQALDMADTPSLPSEQLLYLLEDPECAAEVHKRLPTIKIKPHIIPVLCEYARRGLLSRSQVRQLTANIPWHELVQAWDVRRLYNECQRIIRDAAASPDSYKATGAHADDILDDLFDLWWDDDAKAERVADSEDSLLNQQFEQLFRYLLEGGNSYWEDVLSSLLVVADRRGFWIPQAVDILAVFFPKSLCWTWVPRAMRRKALRLFYKYSAQRRGFLMDEDARHICKESICRRPTGRLDLWAVGGVLHFIGAEPVARLLEWFDWPEVRDAFTEDMEDSVLLLSLEDNSPKGTRYLLDELRRTYELNKPVLMKLLVFVSDSGQLDFLYELGGGEAVAIYQELAKPRADGFTMSRNKLNQTAHRLATRICQGAVPDFLRALLAQERPELSELGLLILGKVANLYPTSELVNTMASLADIELVRCLKVVDWCAGMPHAVDGALAKKLLYHLNADVRAWAEAKPQLAANNSTSSEPLMRKITRLKQSHFEEIATCPEEELHRCVAPCLRVPRLGLTEALAVRGAARPEAEVCAALLGCHDLPERVAEQFARFASWEPDFLQALEELAVSTWLHEVQLPLFGQIWLYRWQAHRSLLESQWKTLPDDLLTLLHDVQSWHGDLLQHRLWQAVADIVAVWRWHNRERLAQLCTRPFGDKLVDCLWNSDAPIVAGILSMLYESEIAPEFMETLKPIVQGMLYDLSPEVNDILRRWTDAVEVPKTPVARRPARPNVPRSLPCDLAHIHTLTDLKELEQWCSGDNITCAEEAALRLVDLGEPGVERLANLLHRKNRIPAACGLAVTVPFWPDGSARQSMVDLVTGDKVDPELRFLVGVGLLELGHYELVPTVLDSACVETDPSWFRPEDWDRLLGVVPSEQQIAERLVISPHPHAYDRAVHTLFKVPVDDSVRQALHDFLDTGTSRTISLREQVAETLRVFGDPYGLPLQLAALARRDPNVSSLLLRDAAPEVVEATVTAMLTAGVAIVDEFRILEMVKNSNTERDTKQECFERMLSDASDGVRPEVLRDIRYSPARARKLRRVAETYAWGVRRGRELTGRFFQVEMIIDGLGYTRFEEDRLYISPLPILRGDRYSRDIVQGLLLHEIGHHVYHRGPEKQVIWQQAQDDNLHELLNLVSDEHLERNLRALDEDFGDKLKKLCAYGFQHSTKEIVVDQLLRSLGTRAFSVLTKSKLRPARKYGCVQVDSGRVLLQMEREGMSFARFMRALRMGLGNRHKDPKVEAGLALFKKKFRNSEMPDLIDIARKLREIFGQETQMLKTFNQDSLLLPNQSDIDKYGEGITTEDIQKEVRRVLDPGKRKDKAAQDAGPPERWINVNPDEHFSPIDNIVPLHHNPAKHAALAQQTKRHARRMRRYLNELGISMELHRFRLRGKMLDRTRLRPLVLHRDPRILMAREPAVKTDLFLGVVIDCSGSMQMAENMEKAKLFGTMLAEATRGHPGIDLRIFGFTDVTIFDAGTASRCAVHDLRADGGNNDAAGLWHAAQVALASHRRAKLLVMISDGLPTECSVAALKGLVKNLSTREKICCAQVAVQPLEEICFPHYIELNEHDLDTAVREFGQIMAKLVKTALRK